MRAIYIARGSSLLPPAFASLFDDSAASSLDVFFDPSSGSVDVQGLTLGTHRDQLLFVLCLPSSLYLDDFYRSKPLKLGALFCSSFCLIDLFHFPGMFNILSKGMRKKGQGGTSRLLGDVEHTVWSLWFLGIYCYSKAFLCVCLLRYFYFIFEVSVSIKAN